LNSKTNWWPALPPNKFRWGLFATLLMLGACEHTDPPAASFEVAAQGLYTGALSTSGDMALIGSLHHGASLWRTQDKERLFNWAHADGEYVDLVAADFSPDGSVAVTTDPRTLVLWNTETGVASNYWATPGAVLDVAVLSDNRHLLIGLEDHSAVLFDAASGAYENTFLHQGEVGSVAVSNDAKLALTGSDDYTAVLWNLNTGEAAFTLQHDNPVRAVAISPLGTYSFTAAQGDLVAIWDNSTGQIRHELHNQLNHGAKSAAFSDDERLLAIGYANRQIALYDVASGARLQTWDPGTRHALRATGAAVLRVAFAKEPGLLYALTGDGRLLELRQG